MPEYSKKMKRLLRELAGVAYERELRRELEKLAVDFGRWQDGSIDTAELSDLIHRFHDGASRDLFKRYNGLNADLLVAHALANGFLLESEAPAEITKAIAPAIGFFRTQKDEPHSS